MDIETGELICPKCKHKKMNKATNWISRKSVINQNIHMQWIFYHSYFGKKYECFFLIHKCCKGDNLNCCRSILRCLFIFFLSLFIFFIWPIFLLCDVIYYFCKKNEIFYCILGEATEVKDINEYIKNMGYDNYTKEYYMKEEIKKLFKCSKCSWSSNNFLDFMNQNTNSEVDTTITPINSLEQGEIIAVHFTTANLKINYSIPCSASDIFSTVVQKLYEEYPDYKNKDCFFYVMEEF